MNIVVFGATGPTGLLVVEKALAAGHHVTAFVRSPAKLTIAHERLVPFRGDVYDPESVSKAVAGSDAVVCAVGVPYTFKPVTVYTAASRHIIAAMREHGVRRFIGITSGGTHPGRDPKNPFFFERILKPLFHTLYDDMREMEHIFEKCDLDWTILRPPRLLNKPPTGKVRIGVGDFSLTNGSEVSRDDLAQIVIQQLTSTDLIGHAAAVCD